jgi:hypothetical protein
MILKQITPHPAVLTPIATGTRSQIARRRSTRIFVNAPIGISGEDRLKCSFTMPAKATALNNVERQEKARQTRTNAPSRGQLTPQRSMFGYKAGAQ